MDSILVSSVLFRRSKSLLGKHKKPWRRVQATLYVSGKLVLKLIDPAPDKKDAGTPGSERVYYLPAPSASGWTPVVLPPFSGEDRADLPNRFFPSSNESYCRRLAFKVHASPAHIDGRQFLGAADLKRLVTLTFSTSSAHEFAEWMSALNCRCLPYPVRPEHSVLGRETLERLSRLPPGRLTISNKVGHVMAVPQRHASINTVSNSLLQRHPHTNLPLSEYGETVAAVVPGSDVVFDPESAALASDIRNAIAMPTQPAAPAPAPVPALPEPVPTKRGRKSKQQSVTFDKNTVNAPPTARSRFSNVTGSEFGGQDISNVELLAWNDTFQTVFDDLAVSVQRHRTAGEDETTAVRTAEHRLRGIAGAFTTMCEAQVRDWVDDTAIAHCRRARAYAVADSEVLSSKAWIPGCEIFDDMPGTIGARSAGVITRVNGWQTSGTRFVPAHDLRYQRAVADGEVEGVAEIDVAADPPPTTDPHDSIAAAESDEAVMRAAGREVSAAAAVVAAILSDPELRAAAPADRVYVPLCCVVDYKGFRVFCQAEISGLAEPCDSSLVIGRDDKGRYVSHSKKAASFIAKLGEVLNIAPYSLPDGSTVALSATTEVHAGDGKFYIMNMAPIFPADLPPTAAGAALAAAEEAGRRLRPEAVLASVDPLVSDSFSNEAGVSAAIQTAQFSASFISETIPALVRNQIDNDAELTAAALACPNVLTDYLHAYGVPIRALGIVAASTAVPAVRYTAKLVATARAAADLLRAAIRAVVRHGFGPNPDSSDGSLTIMFDRAVQKLGPSAGERDLTGAVVGVDATLYRLSADRKRAAATRHINLRIMVMIRDFLAMLCCDQDDAEAMEWWDDVLRPLINEKYGFPLTPSDPVTYGGSVLNVHQRTRLCDSAAAHQTASSMMVRPSDFAPAAIVRALGDLVGFVPSFTDSFVGGKGSILSVATPRARSLLDPWHNLSCSGTDAGAAASVAALLPCIAPPFLSDAARTPSTEDVAKAVSAAKIINNRFSLILAGGNGSASPLCMPSGPAPLLWVALAQAWSMQWAGADPRAAVSTAAEYARIAAAVMDYDLSGLYTHRTDPASSPAPVLRTDVHAALLNRAIVRICLSARLAKIDLQLAEEIADTLGATRGVHESDISAAAAALAAAAAGNAVGHVDYSFDYSTISDAARTEAHVAALLLRTACDAGVRVQTSVAAQLPPYASAVISAQVSSDLAALYLSIGHVATASQYAARAATAASDALTNSHPLKAAVMLLAGRIQTAAGNSTDAFIALESARACIEQAITAAAPVVTARESDAAAAARVAAFAYGEVSVTPTVSEVPCTPADAAHRALKLQLAFIDVEQARAAVAANRLMEAYRHAVNALAIRRSHDPLSTDTYEALLLAADTASHVAKTEAQLSYLEDAVSLLRRRLVGARNAARQCTADCDRLAERIDTACRESAEPAEGEPDSREEEAASTLSLEIRAANAARDAANLAADHEQRRCMREMPLVAGRIVAGALDSTAHGAALMAQMTEMDVEADRERAVSLLSALWSAPSMVKYIQSLAGGDHDEDIMLLVALLRREISVSDEDLAVPLEELMPHHSQPAPVEPSLPPPPAWHLPDFLNLPPPTGAEPSVTPEQWIVSV